MDDLQIILQGGMLTIWLFASYKVLMNKNYMPLNMFGIMLVAGVLMIYVMAADIFTNMAYGDTTWRRWEWYGAKTLIAIAFVKVANMSRRINLLLNCFSKKEK